MFLFISVMLFVSQSSSTVSSLILVPSSLIFIMSMSLEMSFSGLMCYIFVMIFIGGLMVLLVSVASTIQQEQSIFPSLFTMISMSLLTVFLMNVFNDFNCFLKENEMFVTSLELLNYLQVMSIISVLFILVLCLIILSKVLLEFKGLTRVL